MEALGHLASILPTSVLVGGGAAVAGSAALTWYGWMGGETFFTGVFYVFIALLIYVVWYKLSSWACTLPIISSIFCSGGDDGPPTEKATRLRV